MDAEQSTNSPIAPSSPKELCNALYASCASRPADIEFTQQDLLALNVIPNGDLGQLLTCLERLAQDGLLKVMTKDGLPCWKVVKREDAARYKNLGVEEALVYSYIESSGREGIWTRTIRNRTNLHQAVFNRCLKSLESKNFIKSIQSAKFPKRKVYILYHLQPSEDVTGGPFFTDGVLDEEFVHQIGSWVERYVHGKSWYHVPPKPGEKKKKKSRLSVEEAEDLRSHELKEFEKNKNSTILPMPPGYIGYPTVPEITRALNESGISGVEMKAAEMQQLLETLCWDGRLMKVMDGKGYKAAQRPRSDHGEGDRNGLTEAPCGRCPVFDLCEEGGPVNARSCTYFQEWLNL